MENLVDSRMNRKTTRIDLASHPQELSDGIRLEGRNKRRASEEQCAMRYAAALNLVGGKELFSLCHFIALTLHG
jgi:hypothetical protein